MEQNPIKINTQYIFASIVEFRVLNPHICVAYSVMQTFAPLGLRDTHIASK